MSQTNNKSSYLSSKASVLAGHVSKPPQLVPITASLYEVQSILSAALSFCSGVNYPPPSPAPSLVH